jgi:hypothetical protein
VRTVIRWSALTMRTSTPGQASAAIGEYYAPERGAGPRTADVNRRTGIGVVKNMGPSDA